MTVAQILLKGIYYTEELWAVKIVVTFIWGHFEERDGKLIREKVLKSLKV